MKICSTCQCNNSPSSAYCERCGSLLAETAPIARTTAYSYQEQTPPPPPPDQPWNPHQTGSAAVQQMQIYGPFPSSRRFERKRPVGDAISGSFFFIWGVLWVAFGTFTFLEPINQNVGGVLMLAEILLGTGALILSLYFHKYPYLRWWVRVLAELGTLGVSATILIILATATPKDSWYTSFGALFIVYGIATAAIAVW